MTREIFPCFYKQRYEEYTKKTTKIDVWAVFVDECPYYQIIWRKPTTMKNTLGEFEGGRQPHLIKKWPSSRTATIAIILSRNPR